MIRFGFSISPGAPLGVAQEAAQAEALGYDRLGIWDSPALFREPWVTLAAAARDCQRLAIGPWVTNPLSRHPVVTASAAATLDELAPGRTYIGIGSGDTGVLHLGLAGATLARLEQYVLALRRLLQDGQAEYDGQTVRLNWARRRIPIIVAAHGAKSLRLAGRIGDGVVVGLGVTPEAVQGALALLDEGARQAGRRLADIEVWFTCFWFVDPAPGVAQRQAAWAAASFASHFARAGLAGKLVPPEYHEALREFGRAYDKLTHGAVPDEQKDAYAALAERLGVREYFQRRFVFAGTPDEAAAQVQAAVRTGASNFDGAIDAPLPEHQQRIEAWARWVLPRFKSQLEADPMLDLLIRGGRVVTPTHTRLLDVGIHDGQIALVAEPGPAGVEAARVIDAAGRLVLPGGVEAHAHIAEPMYKGWTRGQEVWLQSPEAATRAAIFGGTTTVVSFAFMDVHTRQVEFDANLAVQDRTRIFHQHAYADFAFHPVLTGHPSPATIASLADAIADGTASFKVFTTDVTGGQDGIKIDDGSILDVMQMVAAHGGIVMAHAEDDELVKHMETKLAREGRDQWYNLHLVHTNLSERIAFHSIISLAREAGVPLYLAHVTGREGVAAIATARAQGQPVFGEVLHNYLCFTAADYQQPDGGKYQTYPALKSDADRLALWDGLVHGSLSVVATDEYTTSYQIKTQGKTIATACGGHAGIETRGIIAFSEGYRQGRFSLERFVEVFSSNPAKILGLYPQKGAILPGSDADLVLWDPDVCKTITLSDLHHDSDYSIWEGWAVQGWPVMTLLRGRVVVEAGQLLGHPTDGRFVKRKLQPSMLSAAGAA